MSFYARLLCELVRDGRLDRTARTLVVAGDRADRDALLAAGFANATISNLDPRLDGDGLAPYGWQRLDAEALDLPDDSYTQVLVHMGLHHCASPHRALAEMYRVATSKVLAIENRDSMTMRLARRLGLAADYELEAVSEGGYAHGGHRGGPVPNHVYRWTEREVEKTLASIDPAHRVPVAYRYSLRFPHERVAMMGGWKRAAAHAGRAPLYLATRLFPAQANVFAFLVEKDGRKLHPWMENAARMRQGAGR